MNNTLLTRKYLLMGITSALVAAIPMDAAEPGKLRFGLQGSIVMPSSMSLGNSKEDVDKMDVASTGFGLSAFCQWDLSQKHGIRARLDYLGFGDKKLRTENAYGWVEKWETGANAFGISGEYVYSFVSHGRGAFIFVGAGFLNTKFELTEILTPIEYPIDAIPYPSTSRWTESSSASCLGVSAGFGYYFTKNIGLEVKYTKTLGLEHQLHSGGPKLDANWDWITASFSYRF